MALLRKKRPKEALSAFRKVVEINPDDVDASYFLSVLGARAAPEKAPAEYVKGTFDSCAVDFERILEGKLGYRVPELLSASIRKILKGRCSNLNIVDLGCGTGLIGDHIKDIANKLVGVDISEKMLHVASAKNIYDELITDDIEIALSKMDRQFDLVVAADVFVYLGELSALFRQVARVLKIGGVFAFSVETAEATASYVLRDTGRYAHAVEYINSLSANVGMKEQIQDPIIVRTEHGAPVTGHIFVLEQQGTLVK
jgi:predicted TPR repeat methyltransferase